MKSSSSSYTLQKHVDLLDYTGFSCTKSFLHKVRYQVIICFFSFIFNKINCTQLPVREDSAHSGSYIVVFLNPNRKLESYDQNLNLNMDFRILIFFQIDKYHKLKVSHCRVFFLPCTTHALGDKARNLPKREVRNALSFDSSQTRSPKLPHQHARLGSFNNNYQD